MTKRTGFLLGLLLAINFSLLAQDSLQLISPNGQLQFNLQTDQEGKIGYQVSFRGKEIIQPSTLGLDGWETRLILRSIAAISKDTVWRPVYGERSEVRDAFHEKTFTFFKNNNDRQTLQLEVRAYNEGIAFRYVFPEHLAGGVDVTISKELTTFTLPAGTKAWFTGHAQGAYSLLPLSNWPGEAERPLTLQLGNGLYAALGEAGMVDYCRMKFTLHPSKPNTISCAMYDKVELTTPFATPWRMIMVAEKATQLLQNNDLVLNLNAPNQLKNTSWIKPGKIMRETTLSTKGAKALVDFAVKRHLQYIHFDAGWYGFEYTTASDATEVNVDPRRNPNKDLNLPEVIRYAKKKGIGVFLYVNQRALARQLDTLLPLYHQWGVAGIKFGFVHVGSHRWTTWLHEAIQKCAKYQLMVDIHDEYRPTGFSRTYPNLLTQEGVRGNEEMPEATNSTILPFTRLLAGAADHTICYYHRPELKKRLADTKNTHIMKTTSGHQLALAVVMYSPLQFLYWYDQPTDAQDEPELEFFDQVPTVWNDTKIVAGEPGQFITVARRSGNNWFVGTVTNNDARTVRIDCSFLTPGTAYKAVLYNDDPAAAVRTHVSRKEQLIDHKTVLEVSLQASGGQAIRIEKI